MLVNMGNLPHCDNGEGLAYACPLPAFSLFTSNQGFASLTPGYYLVAPVGAFAFNFGI
jgi:hypothetical protein